jgi:protein ImuB
MLWIALTFPHLSLEAINRTDAARNTTLIDQLAVVITDGPASRPLLHALNGAAREAGLSAGMTLASARAMDSTLIALPRQPEKEWQSLKQIAAWLAQFTPAVSLDATLDRAGIVMEVSTTLRLFGGIGALAARIRRGMASMGYHALLGIAPNALAAELLARATQYQSGVRMCREPAQLRERLADIPLPLFYWPHDMLRALGTLGLTRVRDVLAQPREGLRKRFGEAFLHDLDRACGLKPDPRAYYALPETFDSDIDFLFELIDCEQFIAPITSLLHALEGFLRARGAGVTSLQIVLKHSREAFTTLDFATRAPVRDAKHWLRLIRERLDSTTLETPAVAVALKAHALQHFVEQSESFLPTRQGSRQKADVLLDRLASRLGAANVYRIAVRDDHRPEAAWQTQGTHKARKVVNTSSSPARPIWLLREPRSLNVLNDQPHHHGPLTLLAGPERIETGWWDGKPVARDYFVAQNAQHEVCWIFRDYRQGKRWYLHGFFS